MASPHIDQVTVISSHVNRYVYYYFHIEIWSKCQILPNYYTTAQLIPTLGHMPDMPDELSALLYLLLVVVGKELHFYFSNTLIGMVLWHHIWIQQKPLTHLKITPFPHEAKHLLSYIVRIIYLQ